MATEAEIRQKFKQMGPCYLLCMCCKREIPDVEVYITGKYWKNKDSMGFICPVCGGKSELKLR